ncbi:hypothetical protein NKJ09_22825 [Mesorhizobium sp. M0189]|uniref:hypothetical protein n=1 Tax=Mesorhizobium sp. M0189 TaxID=2956909 RepID=UPI003338865B
MADAFIRGCIEHGDEGFVRPLSEDIQVATDCEVAVMVGVKSRELIRAYWAAGVHTVMLDKGYVRASAGGPVKVWEYWRIAVDGHHPTRYLMSTNHPSDRFDKLRLNVRPWRVAGDSIVIAGSSAKYHAFYGLTDPTSFAQKLVKEISRFSEGREIVYRPKPSWKEAIAVRGARFSFGEGETIDQVLGGAYAMVTHGSNACYEAVLAGVPCIVLGDAVAKPISSIEVEVLGNLILADDATRQQWLHNLAYHQFTMSEMAEGQAWQIVRPLIYG